MVLVQKRRVLCVFALITVTKPGQSLLSMIIMLNQLGKAKLFSTLNLAVGYWQVKVLPESREKTIGSDAFWPPECPSCFPTLNAADLDSEEGPDFVLSTMC